MPVIKKSFQYGQHQVTLETGRIARQATGAVLVNMADTVVLVTVVAAKKADPSKDFFPLTVNYQERTYAAGKIPGGYFKREGKPSEKEVLTSRLIDRPLRPCFPRGFTNEIQIVATVLSINPEIDPDIPALLGASAALSLAGLPFTGPVGAARVGFIADKFVLNPTFEQLEESALDLVVAGTRSAILMVESEAGELPEEVMLDSVLFGHEQMQVAIAAIEEFVREVNPSTFTWTAAVDNAPLKAAIAETFKATLADAYLISDKQTRLAKIAEIRAQALQKLVNAEDPNAPSEHQVEAAFEDIEKDIVRNRILDEGKRIDGRDTKTVRPITIESKVLPRTHGSALFTRGETQALVVVTLGTGRDAQVIDALEGEYKDNFMLHYNFPPYCVGETGPMMGPKRREIGHGRLAKRGLQAVLPTMEEFPYVLRVVSEVTESNGSSSMATVCGTSLALMDAGAPLRAHVAGVAMGLIKEDSRFAVITDILGDEDHLGDMDFKVAGTTDGVTALQMDIKIDGITREIMATALAQAGEARQHILRLMNQVIPEPKSMSEYAPRIICLKINPDKIRDVIGKGGVTIRAITEETGATVDINDDGVVQIFALDKQAGEEAKSRIELLTAEVEVGRIYQGKVVRIMDFGAFVSVLPGREGLLHVSQIAKHRINNVTDVLREGQEVRVKVLEIDRQGRVRLSMKEIEEV